MYSEGANIVSEVENVARTVSLMLDRLSQEDRVKIDTGDTYGMSGTFTAHLFDILEKELPVGVATAQHKDSSCHFYLVIPSNSSEEDIIIDPTASQFPRDYKGIFIGTRSGLKGLVSRLEIINTKSCDNPQEAFERIWGLTSSMMGV